MDQLKGQFSKHRLLPIAINLGLLALMLVLFEPTTKSDDYDMMNLLYGGYNGQYSPFMLYCNPILGYALCALLRILPTVPWFFVVQYALMLWGMICATSVLLKKTHIPAGLLFAFLAFIYYDFFIRITFTKTAGLVITCGFLTLFYQIEHSERLSTHMLVGIMLILAGNLVRGGIFLMLVEVFAGGFGVFLIDRFTQVRAAGTTKLQQEKMQLSLLATRVLFFALTTVMLYGATQTIGSLSGRLWYTNEVWNGFVENNATRGALFDYGIPDYDLHEAEYEAMGVSKADYDMWFSIQWRDDPELLPFEKMEQIRAIANHSQETTFAERLRLAWKNLLSWCFRDTMFYLFIGCCVLVLLTRGKKAAYIIPIILGTCLFAYFYLYLSGRTQHHVDAVIMIAGSLLLLYNCSFPEGKPALAMPVLPVALLVLGFILSFYDELGSSSYYGTDTDYGRIPSQREQYAHTRAQLDLLVDDKEHLYLFNVNDTNNNYPAFTPYQVIPKYYYHNLHRLNMDHIPVHKAVLEDFGVENPIRELADSNTIYCYISNEREAQANIVLDYIRDNYSEDASMLAVKATEQGKVYRYFTKGLAIDDSVLGDSSALSYKFLQQNRQSKGNLHFTGYIYEPGTDSFAQNVYIKTVKKKNNVETFYPTVQGINEDLNDVDKYEGQYSAFSLQMPIKRENAEQYLFYLVLENSNGIYEIPIYTL